MSEILDAAIHETIRDHRSHPFRFRSEHGWHARLIHHLYQKGSFESEGQDWIQSEYPTGSPLRRSKEQNWDIAIVEPEKKVRAVIEVNLKSGPETNTIYEHNDAGEWVPDMTWKTSQLLDDFERMFEARESGNNFHAIEFWDSKKVLAKKPEQKWHWELIRMASNGGELFTRTEWIKWVANEERQMYEDHKASQCKKPGLKVREVLAPEIEKWASKVTLWVSVHRGSNYGAFVLRKGTEKFEKIKL